jgi:hypothetical protein
LPALENRRKAAGIFAVLGAAGMLAAQGLAARDAAALDGAEKVPET